MRRRMKPITAALSRRKDRDHYGGLAGSAEKMAWMRKGYFAIQQMDERKVMTTPSGDLYFSLAVNGITPHETYTKVTGREQKFESLFLRTRDLQARFYRRRITSSFFMANIYRKTGVSPTEHSIYSEAITRLHKWGFNGVGNYSPEKYGEEGKLPYVRMLPLSGMSMGQDRRNIAIRYLCAERRGEDR